MHRNKCHIVCDRFLHLNAIQFTLFRNSRRAVMHLILCTNRYLTIITIPIFIQNEPEQRAGYQILQMQQNIHLISHFSSILHFSICKRNLCEGFEMGKIWFFYCYFPLLLSKRNLTSITDSFFVCSIQSITKQRFSIIACDCTFSKKRTHISIILEIQDHLIQILCKGNRCI